MDTQQFCLKWNSHQANMLTVFEQLLSSETLVDVTLACDGISIKAHKVVLSACSSYFQSLFMDNPCKHPIVIMKDMRQSDLKAIIDFMYKGEVNVSHDQLNALLQTAETLKVKGLAEMNGENRAASVGVSQNTTSSSPQPTIALPVNQTSSDTPVLFTKRKFSRPRKRLRSDSDHSEEVVLTKESGSPQSLPDLERTNFSDTIPVSSKYQTPVQSSVNKSHLSRKSQSSKSSQKPKSLTDSDFSIEPSELMEQTLTTTPVISNGSASGNNVNTSASLSIVPTSLSIVPLNESLSLTADSHSSSQTLGPDSPEDVKPLLSSFDEPIISVDPSQDAAFMDSSALPAIAGTSSGYHEDETALALQNSQSQESDSVEFLAVLSTTPGAVTRKKHKKRQKLQKASLKAMARLKRKAGKKMKSAHKRRTSKKKTHSKNKYPKFSTFSHPTSASSHWNEVHETSHPVSKKSEEFPATAFSSKTVDGNSKLLHQEHKALEAKSSSIDKYAKICSSGALPFPWKHLPSVVLHRYNVQNLEKQLPSEKSSSPPSSSKAVEQQDVPVSSSSWAPPSKTVEVQEVQVLVSPSSEPLMSETGAEVEGIQVLEQLDKNIFENQPIKTKCPLCPLFADDLPSFRYHLKQVHTRPNKTTCPLCSKRLANKRNLRIHLLKHTRQR